MRAFMAWPDLANQQGYGLRFREAREAKVASESRLRFRVEGLTV